MNPAQPPSQQTRQSPPVVLVSRRAQFAAAHRLYREDLPPDENLRIYGPCAWPHGHGHNYVLYVTLKGPVDPATGMVMNLSELKRVMQERVLGPFDHHNLSADVEALRGVNSTAENLVVVIWGLLEPHLPKGLLHEVRVRETENNMSAYRGPSPEEESIMSQTVLLTRRAQFAAAHRMFRPDWSDEKNREVYGKCSNPHGHGHNYVLEVTIRGRIDPRTDMVMNLSELKALMEKHVLEPMDHKNLSVEVPALRGVNTTAENLAVAIWRMLEPHLPEGQLYEVRLQETENNVAIYRGE